MTAQKPAGSSDEKDDDSDVAQGCCLLLLVTVVLTGVGSGMGYGFGGFGGLLVGFTLGIGIPGGFCLWAFIDSESKKGEG
ncbi:MAG: hypothetical protein ACYTFG_21610 [Planctomycetota bacterium]|jgi:hypothetical protein